jgi:hypothetical protein
MSNLSNVVNVQISLVTPPTDAAGFGTVLLLGDAPLNGSFTPPPVGGYTSHQAVAEAGWGELEPVNIAARVAFSQSPAPARIYIAVRQEDQGDLEALTATLNRAAGYDGWYAICPAGIDEDEFAAIAAWTEAREKIFAATYIEGPVPVNDAFYRTALWFGKQTAEQAPTDVPAENLFMHVAACAKFFAYAPGSETWVYKSLAGILPAELTDAQEIEFQEENINYYTEYAGVACAQTGKVRGGEWIDVIRFRDWLKNDMQMRLFTMLRLRGKVPFTDAGISLAQNQMIASLKAGALAGGIAEDEFDGDGNVIPGFTTYVPPAASISQSDKAARALNGCKFSARLAGAIHVLKLSGALTYGE